MQAQVTEKSMYSPTWRDYVDLMKPGIVSLLTLTSLAAMFIATDGMPGWRITIFTMIGGFLAAAGGSVFNCYLECDLDALMTRTRNRPLPAGRMHPSRALYFGLGISSLSILILLIGVGWLVALLALIGILFYVFVYTIWLKRRSMFGTFAGGVAAAIPTLVGWAAATGGLSIEALVLFAIVMYWSPTHYYSLALIRRVEYVRAGIPWLPVIQGPNKARMQIGRYSVLMVILTLLPVGMGLLERYYAVAALVLGGLLVYQSVQLYLSPNSQTAVRYYNYSLLYIALLFSAMLADRAIL